MKTILKSLLPILFFVSTKAVAQVPILNSYTQASATLFLDFDGHTVSGTMWNSNGPIVCGASGLNSTQITEVFNRTAEDFRPFNLNVTTDSTRFLSAPATKRMRVIVTVTSDWYGNVGGTAAVNTFARGDDTPCFVFSQRLSFNIKKIGEAVAHESGHTMGLYHQSSYDNNCKKTADYNLGQGNGEIGWAPIMGAGYFQNLTQWSNGPNSFGCTDYQNDLSVITSGNNNFTYRADDHGNTYAAATAISLSHTATTTQGLIERNNDLDMFKFTVSTTGRLQVKAKPYSIGNNNNGANLDLQLTLYNSSQRALNTFNPANLLSASIDTILNAGTYYLRTEGKGNEFATNYASLGSYTIDASYGSATVLPLYKLELNGRIAGEQHQLSWVIIADETITDLSVEQSIDGTHFTTVSRPDVNAKTISFRPTASGNVQYRLNVRFDNGHQYYSNVVNLRGNSSAKPKMLENVIHHNLRISAPSQMNYAIHDMNGRQIKNGKLSNGVNDISLPGIVNGMYVIKITDGQQEWIEKFIQQ